MTTLAELEARVAAWEARVAALEAERVDYRAVLAAINSLGANQREQAERLTGVESRLTGVESRLTAVGTEIGNLKNEVRTGFRSVEDQMAELKDIVIRALDS